MTVHTPSTLIWSPLFAGYYAFLTVRVVRNRKKFRVSIGHDTPRVTEEKPKVYTNLDLAIRAHGNFVETTPITLLFIALCELNGANKAYIHFALASFFASRIIHAEYGMMQKNALGWGRYYGMLITLWVGGTTSLYNGILALGYIKSLLSL